jgi:pathogenesis-related protein 1
MKKSVAGRSVDVSFALLLSIVCSLFVGCGGGGGGSGNSGDDNISGTGDGGDTGNGGDDLGGDSVDVDCGVIVPGASRQDDYLCEHNAVRATASPAPDPQLDSLVWDDGLADIARAHAEECRFEHNTDAGSGYPGSVGENLYIRGSASVTPADVVGLWAAEAQAYDYATNSCEPGKVCGHYTQLVWRETTRLGCGEAFCTDIAVGGSIWSEGLLVVCNYSPAGNFSGRRPY